MKTLSLTSVMISLSLAMALPSFGAESSSSATTAAPQTSVGETAKKSAGDVKDGLGGAVTAPLDDLNLKREAIPDILLKAVAGTYDLAGMDKCGAIGQEVTALDAVLGNDFDQISDAAKETLTERGGELASHTTLSVVKGAAESVIPMRGLVREVSGAEKHQKAYNNAVMAGQVRRAYLKGVGLKMNCAAPAAPAWFIPVTKAAKARR